MYCLGVLPGACCLLPRHLGTLWWLVAGPTPALEVLRGHQASPTVVSSPTLLHPPTHPPTHLRWPPANPGVPADPLLLLQLLILDKEAAHAATADILTQHCIAHDRSEDLRAEAAAAAGGPGGAAAAGKQEAAEEEPAAAAAEEKPKAAAAGGRRGGKKKEGGSS